MIVFIDIAEMRRGFGVFFHSEQLPAGCPSFRQIRSRQNPESVSTEDITGVFRANFVTCTHAEGD